MKILFVAADRMEFAGMVRRARNVRGADLPLDWSRQAELGGHETMLVANGIGWARAKEAAVTGIRTFSPDAVVSTGFCGALSPLLEVAELVTADRVIGPGVLYPARTVSGPAQGAVHSVSYVAQTAEQKLQLSAGGAIAVEMEAVGVAEVVSQASLPFFCIRAVTDLAGETLANDFNGALRADGHFATMNILRVALLDPAIRLPELIRLRKRCTLAARALGDFFAENRF